MIIKQIEIDDKLWEMIVKFSELINWPANKLINYFLKTMMDSYGEATNKCSGVSELIYNEFLEEPFLEKLAKIFK